MKLSILHMKVKGRRWYRHYPQLWNPEHAETFKERERESGGLEASVTSPVKEGEGIRRA